MPIDLKSGVEALGTLDRGFAVIVKYAARLKADPDRAANSLTTALDEVEKSCRALDDGLKTYLALCLKQDAEPIGADLIAISGGQLAIGVKQGLGSCNKIWNIYQNELNRWFERVFKKDSPAYRAIENVFMDLSNADQDMFQAMARAADEVQRVADEAVLAVSGDDEQQVRRVLRASFKEIQALRAQANRIMARLYDLRARFIEISGVT